DADNDPVTVALAFSLDGTTFTPIPANPWAYAATLGTGTRSVVVRATPSDFEDTGAAVMTLPFFIGNEAPAVAITGRNGTSGGIAFTYTLSDVSGDTGRVRAEFHRASKSFAPATLTTTATTALATT